MKIRAYLEADEVQVTALWEAAGLTRPWNQPLRDVARKLAVQPELFIVGERTDKVIASAMAGYDGHRGWINYLAVHPEFERQGLGRAMMAHAEALLIARGCPKINVQIRRGNSAVTEFYQSIGFSEDDVVSMGKRLIPDH